MLKNIVILIVVDYKNYFNQKVIYQNKALLNHYYNYLNNELIKNIIYLIYIDNMIYYILKIRFDIILTN